MADASDSKSDVGDYVWVQVPSPAVSNRKLVDSGFLFLFDIFPSTNLRNCTLGFCSSIPPEYIYPASFPVAFQ